MASAPLQMSFSGPLDADSYSVMPWIIQGSSRNNITTHRPVTLLWLLIPRPTAHGAQEDRKEYRKKENQETLRKSPTVSRDLQAAIQRGD